MQKNNEQTKARLLERGCFKRKENHRKQTLNINVYEPSRKMRERNLEVRKARKFLHKESERKLTYIGIDWLSSEMDGPLNMKCIIMYINICKS